MPKAGETEGHPTAATAAGKAWPTSPGREVVQKLAGQTGANYIISDDGAFEQFGGFTQY